MRLVGITIKWININTKQHFVNSAQLFVKSTILDVNPLANREMNPINQEVESFVARNKMKSTLLVILVVGVFLGFLSPFGMDDLPLHWSIIYWEVTCAIGFAVFMPITYYGNLLLKNVLNRHWCRVAVSSFFASIILSLILPLTNSIFFTQTVSFSTQFWAILPKVFVIGSVLTFVSMMENYFKWQKTELLAQQKLNQEFKQQSEQSKDLPLERFMELLPVNKRGDLYCLEMADHYVKVYTSQGHHLLLMRFKDALLMLSDYQGLQTHRSWWVAKAAITALKKDGRKITLNLVNNVEVPVSRTYAEAVKSASIH